jgi:hypothetical protein
MAKVREQAKTSVGPGGAGPYAAAPVGWGARLGGIMQEVQHRAGRVLAPPPRAQNGDAAAPPRPRSEMSRFFIGMMAYVIGSFLLQYLVLLANNVFKLNLQAAQTLFPKGTPIIGTMTKFSLIYIMGLIALIWLLYRTNIMPRDLFSAQRNARLNAQRGAQGGARGGTTTSATPSTRHSGRRRSIATATVPASRATPTVRRPAAPSRTAATAARRASHGPTAVARGDTGDDHYDRVRAQQRARRRKR